MATLVVLLVPLALLHQTWGVKPTPTPAVQSVKDLDVAGTDAIRDMIRFYNNHYAGQGPPAPLPDISYKKEKLGLSGKTSYDLKALDGKMFSKGVKLSTNLANFDLKVEQNAANYTVHTLTVNIPITIEDLKLRYDTLNIDFHMSDTPTRAPNKNTGRSSSLKPKDTTTGAVTVLIGKNKFTLHAVMAHYYTGDDGICLVTIDKMTADEFEITDLKISGITDATTQAIVDALAIKFTASLLKDTYAPQIIETIIEGTAPKFFPFCYYVTPDRFAAYSA